MLLGLHGHRDKQEFKKSVEQGIVLAFKALVPQRGIDFQSTSEHNTLIQGWWHN